MQYIELHKYIQLDIYLHLYWDLRIWKFQILEVETWQNLQYRRHAETETLSSINNSSVKVRVNVQG